MANDLIEKWNSRYRDDLSRKEVKARDVLVNNLHLLPAHGLVLDVAMGAGGNAAFLQQKGMRVMGVDISDVAVRAAKQRCPDLMAVIGDLCAFSFLPARFDAILNFYFLQRDLVARFPSFLKPGGLVIMETLTRSMLNIKPELSAENLLAEGELLTLFKDWCILDYGEGLYPSSTGSKKAIAWIVAQLPDISSKD